MARPVSVRVETFGTDVVPDDVIGDLVERFFDLRPGAIIRRLDLQRPIYRPLAAYGHFGRTDLELPWEQTDVAPLLRAAVFGRDGAGGAAEAAAAGARPVRVPDGAGH